MFHLVNFSLKRFLCSPELELLFFYDHLMLSMLGKKFSRQLEIFFLIFFPRKQADISCKLIVSLGDNLHVMSKPIFWEK